MSKTTDQAAKDAGARIRAAFDKESTHIRVGSWNGSEGCTVELVGRLSDLHGTVCTCCPKRKAVA